MLRRGRSAWALSTYNTTACSGWETPRQGLKNIFSNHKGRWMILQRLFRTSLKMVLIAGSSVHSSRVCKTEPI